MHKEAILMNFLERYIKHQEQKSAKSSLLQTYLVSLISLCLTVTMLLGTTMAWFTTSVDVPQNEIYAGTLDVDLQLMNPTMTADGDGQAQWTSLKTDERSTPTMVFDGDAPWQAGLVQVRTFKIIDNGDIPFTYCFSLTPSQGKALVTVRDSAETQVDIQSELAFLESFEVYTRIGDAVGFQNGDLLNPKEWTLVGTLDQLLSGKTVNGTTTYDAVDMEVFRGGRENMVVDKDQQGNDLPPCVIHSVAIKMSEDAVSEVDADVDYSGYQLNFGIKLVANQMGTPEVVVDADKLAALLDQGYSVKISNDIELDNTLNLNGNLLNGQVAEENKLPVLKITDEMTDTPAITTTGGTVRYVKIMGADYKDSKAIVTNGEQVLKQNLYIDHVTIDGVATAIQVEGDGKSKVQVTNSTITGAIDCKGVSSVDFVSCTLGNTNFANGSMIVDSNVTFTNCDFTAKEVVKFLLLPENGQRDGAQEKIVVTFDNCTVDGQQVTDKNLLAQLGVGENFSDRYSFVFVNGNAN